MKLPPATDRQGFEDLAGNRSVPESRPLLSPWENQALYNRRPFELGQLESELIDVRMQRQLNPCPVPLTPVQLRLWRTIQAQEERLSALRMAAASVRILGPLNVPLLKTCIDTVVQRHESLRTRIVLFDGVPRQHVDRSSGCRFDVIDLSEVPSELVERNAKQLAEHFVSEKIDLSIGPLFAAKLLRLSDLEHVLILALDHIVSDAASYVILVREIWAVYDQATQRTRLSLPQLPIQFADYAIWQERTYDAWRKNHEAYWRARLAGAPRIELPRDYETPHTAEPGVSMLHFPLGKTLTQRLLDICVRERTRSAIVVFAIYVVAVSRWCRQRDLVLTFVSHGRHRHELENMIGFLASHLRFRLTITANDHFLSLLRKVDIEFHSAYEHWDFGRAPDLIPECTTDLHFNWLPNIPSRMSVPAHRKAGALSLQAFPLRPTVPEIFSTAVSQSAAGFIVTVTYRPDLFSKTTIARFGHDLQALATKLLQHPRSHVTSIPYPL